MNRGWTEHQYRQFQRQERHDYAVAQVRQAETDRQHQEAHMNTVYKTAHGDRVPKFPDTDRDDRVTELRAALADLWDLAAAERDRQRSVDSSSAVDPQRFPVIGRG